MKIGNETRIGRDMAYKFFFTIIFACLLSLANQASCFATTVTLQWDPNTDTGLVGYKVYYQADSSTPQPFQGPGATPVLIGNTTTTATISGLDSSHGYYFAVTAYTSTAESAYSNMVYVPQMVPPNVTAFTLQSPYSLLTVPITTFTATDNVAVTGYCVTLTNSSSGCTWNATAPGSVTFPSYGTQAAYAWAKDAAGNISKSVSSSVTIVSDTTPPTVSITTPTSTVSGTVTITANASDNIGVTKVEIYLDSATTPFYLTNTSSFSYNWNTATVANGTHTLTAKAYDAAGKIGQSTITVTVNNQLTDTTAPTVNTFTLPATATNLTVPISSFTATDNVGVTGYCVTTTNSSTGCSWSANPQSTVTFGSTGSQTAWAWAKDAAGNISAGVSASTNITMPVTTGETSILSTDDSGNANLLMAQSATLGQTATIQSLSFYVATAAGNLRMGVYDATGTGGGPGKLVASTAEITPTTGWNTANVTTPVSLNAGTYWLAYLPSSNGLHFRVNNSTGTAKYYSYTYGAMPSTFSASPSTITGHWSFYATFASTSTINPVQSIIWRDPTAGRSTIWDMNGTTWTGGYTNLPNVPGPDWDIAGVGDFRGTGNSDIVWRNPTTGQDVIWFMNGTTWTGGSASLPSIADVNWKIRGVADFNGDGKPDILWRNTSTGQNVIWFMNGTTWAGTSSELPNVPGPDWDIAGVGDFNKDGKPDILWRNSKTGQNVVWYMNGATWDGSSSGTLPSAPAPWTVAGVGDFNGDASLDILWRNTATGVNTVWFLNGVTFTGSGTLINVPTSWSVKGVH